MASGQSLVRKGKNCVAVVKNALDDIHAGQTQKATEKLCKLKEDSVYLAAEAEELAKRLEKVEAYYIGEGEKTLTRIGEVGCQEEEFRREKEAEEISLASHKSVLRDEESRLSSAESDLRDAENKLEKAKKDEEDNVRVGAITGAVVGFLAFGVGALVGAGLGAGVGAIVNACVDEVSDAKDRVSRRRNDLSQARSAVRESERRVLSIQSKISTLETETRQLKAKRLEYHQKADEIKEGIILLKKSVEFWQLFKQAADYGTSRTSLLQKIVDKANEKGDYKALQSTGSRRVAVTFLDAWEEMESTTEAGRSHCFQIEFSCIFCHHNYTSLPHVSRDGDLACDHCSYRCAIQN